MIITGKTHEIPRKINPNNNIYFTGNSTELLNWNRLFKTESRLVDFYR